MTSLRPAAIAFDAIAPLFDARFGAWESVAAQRRAVRAALLQQFSAGGHILEIGGGTGEDAAYLAARGYSVLSTDPSPAMVELASTKLAPLGSSAQVTAAEDLERFAEHHVASGGAAFDGAFSNFAPLNCVADLSPVARGLSLLLRPGAAAMLVVFGTCCPGEMIVETLHNRPEQALRRFKTGLVDARLARRAFQVTYHRRKDMLRAFSPYFTLERRIGIGVAVPPSAAEPWISDHPNFLRLLERADRFLGPVVPVFGDHVLYQLRRKDR